MFDQTVLTSRLSHLKAKRIIKIRELKDQSLPGLSEIHSKVLKCILAAIKKIEDAPKTYGLCENCGEAIPLKRLESVPETAYCRDCATQKDEKNGRQKMERTGS